MDEITLDDKTYVSSKRAAQITGYAKDYVGQLCREGRVEARLVGRNWYVLETSIRDHRFGAPPAKEPVKTESTSVHEWVPSNYTSEVVPELPILAPVTQIEAPAQVPAAVPAEVSSIDVENTMHFGDKAGIHVFEENIGSSVATAPALDTESAEVKSDVVQEMQSAWQDWFSRTNELKVSEEILLENEPVALELPSEAPLITEDDDESSFDKVTTPIAIERVLEPEESEPEVSELEESVPVIASYTEDHDEYAERVPIKRSYRREVTAQNTQDSSFVAPEGRIVRERKVSPSKKRKTMVQVSKTSGGNGSSLVLRVVLVILALAAIGIAAIGSGKLDSFLAQAHLNYSPINYLVGQSSVQKAN